MGETLGDLAKSGYIAISTGPFGSALHAHDYQETGVSVIPTEAIEPGRLRHDRIVRISEQKARELARHRLQLGDIVFARRGVQACGLSALVAERDGEAIAGTGVITLRVLAPEKVDPGFLACAVGAPLSVRWLKQHAIGATMPNLNSSVVLGLPIHLPDIQTQRAISGILSTLDNKIELNQRMSETLEEMARALFKSWFVDFEPVRAKAEGRDTGLPNHLADLFPGRLVDSDFGEIPEGWQVGTLADFASLNPETWSKETRAATINYVDLSNTKWGRIEMVTRYSQQDAPSRAQRVLRPRDAIVGTVRPGNGAYAYVSENGLTGSTGFAVLRPLKAEFAEFVYFAVTSAENIERLSHLADGGAYPAVRPEVVAATQAIKASDDVIERYSCVAGALLAKMAENERESGTLAALRDSLLPKLLSGEIRIQQKVKTREVVA